MRMPRKMWERAFPLAAYFCRKCGSRFRTVRPPETASAGEEWLVCPEPPRGVDLDNAVSSLLVRVTHKEAPSCPEVSSTDQRIDTLLKTVAQVVG